MARPRPRRRSSRGRRKTGTALQRMLPQIPRGSSAWRHFRIAQAEFLTGMQQLLHDSLEEVELRVRPARELRRIDVQE